MPEKETATSVRTGDAVTTEVPTAQEAYVASLLREREGYARYSRADRVAAVDVELERLGVEVPGGGRETAVESKPRRTARGKS